jgi:hypothetical protein
VKHEVPGGGVATGRPTRPYEEEAVSGSPAPPGVPAAELSEDDLLRELRHLHETRHETFRHGSAGALEAHSRRTAQLEAEYLRRHPEREVDPDRLRAGARERADQP